MGVADPSLLGFVVAMTISVTDFPPTSNVISGRIPLLGVKVSRYETRWAHSVVWAL